MRRAQAGFCRVSGARLAWLEKMENGQWRMEKWRALRARGWYQVRFDYKQS
jgi:hypothetical protein